MAADAGKALLLASAATPDQNRFIAIRPKLGIARPGDDEC